MANKRMINGETWEDEFFTTLTIFERLLWLGIITQSADDQGRLRDSAALIRSNVFPLDDVALKDILTALDKYSKAGKIVRYKADNKELIQIVNWWKHQKPRWAGASNYPAPDGWTDRERYHGANNEMIVKNWELSGGYIADYIDNNISDSLHHDVKDDVKDDIKDDDEQISTPKISSLHAAFVTGFQRDYYSNECDNWINEFSLMAQEGVTGEDITQAFKQLGKRYTITSPKSIKNAAITCKNKRLDPQSKNGDGKKLSDIRFDNIDAIKERGGING
ncbi:MAG: hypothetical protein WCY09_09695 [Candidatus Omnitrophota bacterium]